MNKIQNKVLAAYREAFNMSESVFSEFFDIHGDVFDFLRDNALYFDGDNRGWIPYMGFYIDHDTLTSIADKHMRGMRWHYVWRHKYVFDSELDHAERNIEEEYPHYGATVDAALDRIREIRQENAEFNKYTAEVEDAWNSFSDKAENALDAKEKGALRKELRKKIRDIEKKYKSHLVRRSCDREAFQFSFYLGVAPGTSSDVFNLNRERLHKIYESLNGDLSSICTFEDAEKAAMEVLGVKVNRDFCVCLLFLAKQVGAKENI